MGTFYIFECRSFRMFDEEACEWEYFYIFAWRAFRNDLHCPQLAGTHYEDDPNHAPSLKGPMLNPVKPTDSAYSRVHPLSTSMTPVQKPLQRPSASLRQAAKEPLGAGAPRRPWEERARISTMVFYTILYHTILYCNALPYNVFNVLYSTLLYYTKGCGFQHEGTEDHRVTAVSAPTRDCFCGSYSILAP